MRYLGIVLAAAAVARPLAAQDGGKVYRAAVPSVVWVHSARPGGLATGSGALVDRDRRLVLTNYHVVEDAPTATVFFPQFRDGQPIPEKGYYADRAARLGVPGRVVATDKKADLAVIRVAAVPADAAGIRLAAASPGPGDTVHSIGNAGKSGALWGYVRGTVRQVYRKTWKARLDRRVLTFEARVVETDSPTNPGDSGGPLLNDAGELVGVTQGGAIEANSVSTFVDVSEVKPLLDRRPGGVSPPSDRSGSDHGAPTPPARQASPPPARREKPAAVADAADLFSPAAEAAANTALADLFARGLDVVVETYPAAPDAWREQANKASPGDRLRMMREWADERLKLANARGFAVLVCLDPRTAVVEVPADTADRLPPDFAKKAGDALASFLREKVPDAGLADVLKMAADGLKDGKPAAPTGQGGGDFE